MKKPLVT